MLIFFEFKALAITGLLSVIVSGGIGIWMAYSGYGVWSVVTQTLLSFFCNALFMWLYLRWIPSFKISLRSFKSPWNFGSKPLVVALINTLYVNMYALLIGKRYSTTDHASKIYQKAGVRYFKEEKKGHGNARNCGLHHARGKYYLCMDSDTIYPPTYIESMVNILEREGVVAANAHYGFISKDHSLLSLAIYEFVRNINAYIKVIKRPESMVSGAVFGFVIEPVRSIGFRTNIKRGEDGAIAYELKRYGRIIFTKQKRARAITSFRSLSGNSSICSMLLRRIGEQMRKFRHYFYSKTDAECKDEESNILK